MHLNVSNCIMGWLPLIGSLKLQVCFAEYRLFYRAHLQKRPIILRSLLMHLNVTNCIDLKYPQRYSNICHD